MDLLKQLQSQLSEIWRRWDRGQRIGIIAVACLCIAGIAGLSMWASTQEFVTLTNSLTPAQAHEVVSTLQAEGIDYKLNFSGSAVSVPIGNISQARLAIKELGQDVAIDDTESSSGWWSDPGEQRSRQQRAEERRLAASIEQLQSVRSATVHISKSDASPFIREQIPAKASVVLQLQSGAGFSGSDARAIVSLVSHAVENLEPENTIIVDTDGHVLSSHDAIGGDVTGQLDFRQKLERDLSAKAEAMLAPILGPGRAVVRVTADVDFTETNTARTSYDPDAKVKVHESIKSESTRGDSQRTGATGTASNVGGLGAGSGGAETESETIETDYQNTETVDTVREAPGKLKRLTVAAVIELPEVDSSADPAVAAAPTITAEQIEKIIRQAVGFDESRDDQIEVLAAKMTGLPDLSVPIGWTSTLKDLAPLASSASLGIASIIALFLGMKLIGKLKPVVVEVERNEGMDPEVRERLADLSEEILQYPETVSTVLAGWLADQQATPANQNSAIRKAA
jgi:flagellar M-ring protein FliF